MILFTKYLNKFSLFQKNYCPCPCHTLAPQLLCVYYINVFSMGIKFAVAKWDDDDMHCKSLIIYIYTFCVNFKFSCNIQIKIFTISCTKEVYAIYLSFLSTFLPLKDTDDVKIGCNINVKSIIKMSLARMNNINSRKKCMQLNEFR